MIWLPQWQISMKVICIKPQQNIWNKVENLGIWCIPCSMMMTSSNGNIFRVTGLLCREFTCHSEFPAQRPVMRSFDVFLPCAWINDWVNNREAGDLRCYRGHYGINVMMISIQQLLIIKFTKYLGFIFFEVQISSQWFPQATIKVFKQTFPIHTMDSIMNT